MRVGIRELKAHLSQYVEAAKAGERVEITQRGKVVVTMSALPAADEVELPERLRQLIAEGRVTPATRRGPFMEFTPVKASASVEAILAEDRDDE